MAPKKSEKKENNGATLGFEQKLWQAADALRNNMDAAEYKHVVLGLIFLKYISDAFEARYLYLKAAVDDPKNEYYLRPDLPRREGAVSDLLEDQDEYISQRIFWVPKEARWSHLKANAPQPTIGKLVDDAMSAIERDNPSLKGVLPKDYARPGLDKKGLKLALDFVEGNVGIPGSELLPSHFTLFPLVSVFAIRKDLSAAEESALRRWFLLANVFSRYAGSAETVLNQDLGVLGVECENVCGLLDQLLRDLRAEPKVTSQDLEKAGTNSPFFPLAFLAVMRRDPNDWFKGIRIRRENFAEDQRIEYHHIFPKKLLNEREIDRYTRDEMANIAFLAQRANRRISSKKPSDYLAEIEPRRLESQFVPMDKSLWELDRFDDFLAARRQLLAEAMNEVLQG